MLLLWVHEEARLMLCIERRILGM